MWEGEGGAGDKEVEVININCGCSISSEKVFVWVHSRGGIMSHMCESQVTVVRIKQVLLRVGS